MNNEIVKAIVDLIQQGGTAATWLIVLFWIKSLLVHIVWGSILGIFLLKGIALARYATEQYWNREKK